MRQIFITLIFSIFLILLSTTLFIPYPYAAGDHQYHNAKFLEEQGVAWIMRENDIDNSKILSILDEDMSQKSTKLKEMIESDGAKKIAELLINEERIVNSA